MIISDLKVMNNNRGWYVGRTYQDNEMGDIDFPYSRDSGYFDTEEEAQAYLDAPVVTAIYH